MPYLAINRGTKESAVALVLNDGVLRWVFTEERYTRKKYDSDFPYFSIVDIKHYIDRDILFNSYIEENDIIDFFNSYFPGIKFGERVDLNHHLLHCYESFYTSGFNRAAVLVVDGVGDNIGNDYESISLYHKIGRETKLLKKYYRKSSLGSYYAAGSLTFGFKDNEEGHFMGLSSYGIPFEKRYARFEKGEIIIDNLDDPLREYKTNHNTLECINSVNFAATVQRDTTECLLGLVKYIKELTGEDNLCLSGGVFNNVLANNVICESGVFKNVWCSPAPGDYGITVGKCYFDYEKNTPDTDINYHRIENAYLGAEYNDDTITKYLNDNGIEYEETDISDIGSMLSRDYVLAWFQGRSEYGRRALGHRSIIANPSKRSNYNKISMIIKNRAPYRPLACTVPDKLFDMMFDVKNKDLTEYMLRAIKIKEEIRDKIYACVAIDNTTRPQNLHRDVNSELYDVIMNFYECTGIPAVINTSLNGMGEPMVESLYDLFVFCNTKPEIDYIILNAKYKIKNKKVIDYLLNHYISKKH